MDGNTGRLPDPVLTSGDRRRCVRQKLHTPVYASFNGPQTGMVVDLSELLDLHEDGFSVLTSERLEVKRAVTLSLDLPETKSFIHGHGEVVWSDGAGRGGVRFSGLPDSSRQILKQWLFANLLVASANHAARTEQIARREREEENISELVQVADPRVASSRNAIPASERGAALSLVEAVRWEVLERGDDVDAVLQLITRRAVNLTGASGAGLAFLTDGAMICRAQAGESAPPLGSRVDAEHGLSGECVRSGRLVASEDLANDPRVDPEIARALGIGSLIAAPILSEFGVVGLLEVFSPHPRGFAKAHETVLQRLVEMVPGAQQGTRLGSTFRVPADEPSVAFKQVPDVPEEAPQIYSPEPVFIKSILAEPALTQFESDPSAHETLRERTLREETLQEEAEVAEQQRLSRVNRAVVSESGLELPDRAVSTRRSRLLQLVLLGGAVAVVAMAIGYLTAPMIEKWMSQSQASVSASSLTGVRQTSAVNSIPSPKSVSDVRTLAEKGDAEAQWQMGLRYHNGEDVPQDDAQAVEWYERAAEQGNASAQSALGAYYWQGRGVTPNLTKAYFWSAIAMAHGDEISKGRLEGLTSQMTREQIAAARQQAEDWIHAHTYGPKASVSN